MPATKAQSDIGQTVAEYAVTLSVITLAVVGTFTLLGSTISNTIQSVIAMI